ncbi:LysR substrate-binding domain-containing protein [Polaromonas sp. SM01]|uniref:LysR substrate-binding domain-containing protein n=1 Tax=Polaromonas sp. SM01 TaxID=3085630 RepID=UPI002981453E|nr:LysR substrate-binding domain-containing protein [Polaromonas sp. SM01]MDW5442144.1 LysR substrate-binding domain-containing protein [Polaromonas sp. SM01]
MELRHVRYFDAIAETLNFTRAAERLHVTQSTLSHQIKQMEDELGVALFDRSNKKIRMTEAGEILRTYMTPALEQIDRGVQALRGDAEFLSGTIRLGTTPSFNTRMVPLCVSTFLHHYPNIQVVVEELSGDMLARRISSGELDLAVSYRPADGTGLWFEPLYNEELRLVVAASHPLAKRRRVRMVELHHVRMVLLPKEYLTRQLLDECFEAAGATPLVVAQLNSIWPMFELIRQTDLAGIFGETAVTPSADLRAVPLEDPVPIRTPGLLWQKGATRSPTLKHFADIIRRAAGQIG